MSGFAARVWERDGDRRREVAVAAITCRGKNCWLLNEWVRIRECRSLCMCLWQLVKLCKQVTMSKLNLEPTQCKVRLKDMASGWLRKNRS